MNNAHEHPAISRTLRTGYPAQHKPILCDTCKDEISSHEIHGKGSARWASEIEDFPIAVTKYHFPECQQERTETP